MQVSVLMPIKNAAPWIHNTIVSIQKQSFEDWELVCIDDHSTDSCKAIIDSFSDTRIRYYTNSGMGIIPSLQLGLRKSQGEFITRMDADDIMPPDRLQSMVEAIKASATKTVVTGKVQYFGECVSEGYKKYEAWLNDRIDHNDHFNNIYRECVIASPNWMTRKSDLINDQIFEQLQYPEDYDMVFRWNKKGYQIKCVNDVTLHWREHPARTSRNSDTYGQDSFFQLKLNWFLELEGQSGSPLAIVGHGRKAKIVSDFMIKHGVNFNQYSIHHERHGDHILDPASIHEDKMLICVYPDDLSEIEKFLARKKYAIGENAWYL